MMQIFLMLLLFFGGLLQSPATSSDVANDSPEMQAVPLLADGEPTETKIFGRRPKPQPTPKQPDVEQPRPVEVPQFEFPTDPVEADVEEAGLKDWDKEDWQTFIGLIMALIGAFGGGIGGFQVAKKKLKA